MTRKYLFFGQTTPNGTLINHFLSGNIQDNINTFDGTSMKNQGISNQTQSTTNLKRINLGRKIWMENSNKYACKYYFF